MTEWCHLCISISSPRPSGGITCTRRHRGPPPRCLGLPAHAPLPASAGWLRGAVCSGDERMTFDDASTTLHPIARGAFALFFDAIQRDELLRVVRPFETFRSPQAQNLALAKKHSKVSAWRSVHQYGCAVDIVPCPGGQWTWEWPHWDRLHRCGERFGIAAPIEWDKPHHVLMNWRHDLRDWLLLNKFT